MFYIFGRSVWSSCYSVAASHVPFLYGGPDLAASLPSSWPPSTWPATAHTLKPLNLQKINLNNSSVKIFKICAYIAFPWQINFFL